MKGCFILYCLGLFRTSRMELSENYLTAFNRTRTRASLTRKYKVAENDDKHNPKAPLPFYICTFLIYTEVDKRFLSN